MSILDRPGTNPGAHDPETTGELDPSAIATLAEGEVLGTALEGEAGADGKSPVDANDFELAPVKPFTAAASAFLATAGAAWMLGGIFTGQLARILGVVGALIGAGVVGLGQRKKMPVFVQFLAMPIAAAAGIGVIATSANGSSIPALISDALHSGGLSQPPTPFDPGWRFLILVLCAGIAATAASGALAFNAVKLAPFVPAPVIAAGVLIQPEGKELIGVGPSLALAVGALAVAFGGELSRDTDAGAKFEARRLGKAATLVVAMIAALVGLSQLGFLYPPTEDSTVIPPKRPQIPPKVSNYDEVLFRVKQEVSTPLRLGVLDVYDGVAWLTPPYDPKRFVTVTDALFPAFVSDRSSGWDVPQEAPKGKLVKTEVTISKESAGREIPDVTGTVSATGVPKNTKFDPRTQVLRLPGRSTKGTTYTVTSVTPPDAGQLNKATKIPDALKAYTQAPPELPTTVKRLLDSIPTSQSLYERLQTLRTKYYSTVTAAGPGNPVDLPPERVAEFLDGTPASPYEITASEVLLARWLGIPARIGYGYYNPDAKAAKDGLIPITPADGAMWLEAYFDGSGWTPILGKPPKAQASISNNKKNKQQVLPNGLISAQLYIPIEQEGVALLYRIVQFWLVRVAIALGIGLFFWILLPAGIKGYRRVRRRRWADKRGGRARIAVAYADLRDRAIDFNMGHPTLTPLQFQDVLEPDDDHTQLAWLVTRSMWGDLRRDLRESDVEAAETLGRNLAKRLSAGQPFLTRVVALGSRASLLDPWDRTLPNPYWRRSLPSIVSAALRRVGRVLMRTLSPRRALRAIRGGAGRRAVNSSAVIALLCTLFLGGCVQKPDLSFAPQHDAVLPSVPAKVEKFSFQPTKEGAKLFDKHRNRSLISTFNMYVVREDNVAIGTLQTSSFKPGLRSENRKVREGVLTSLGGTPTISRVGGQVFYTVIVNELKLVVWFPPDGLTYHLLAATKDLADPSGLLAKLIAVEQGRDASSVSTAEGAPPADVRQG